MSTGDERSPVPLDSDSDASQDIHPVDVVIQQAIHRQRSPPEVPRSNTNAGKRKRDPTPPNADVISLHSSSSNEGSYESDRQDAENGTFPTPVSGPTKSVAPAPIGVTVVEEGAQTRNPEVQRLLRGARQVPSLQHAVLSPLDQKSASCSHVLTSWDTKYLGKVSTIDQRAAMQLRTSSRPS